VTGRPRRCGWFDAVAVRYAVKLNGAESVALTKLDVLDTLDEVPVCVGYRYRGRELSEFPSGLEALAGVVPVYETLPGWRTETRGVLEFEALPLAAKQYVEFLEEQIGAEVGILSTGPKREETVVRASAALGRWLDERLAAVVAGRDA
jgi:adenylosuccinate synthase